MVESCALEDPFGSAVQCLTLLSCAGALVLKKCREGPDRLWGDFLLDASKQLIGAGWAHLLIWAAAGAPDDACDLLWLRIVLAATFEVLVEYMLLNMAWGMVESLMEDTADDFRSGEYRDAFGHLDLAKYSQQLGVWLGCVTGAKFAGAILMRELGGVLRVVVEVPLALVAWSSPMEMAVVAVLTPCAAGMLQVWLTDNFLQKGGLVPLSEFADALALAKLPSLRGDWVRPLLSGGDARSRDFSVLASAAAAAARDGKADVEAAAGFGTGAWLGGARAAGIGSKPPASIARPRSPELQNPELREALAGLQQQVARAAGSAMDAAAAWEAVEETEDYGPLEGISGWREDLGESEENEEQDLYRAPMAAVSPLPPQAPSLREGTWPSSGSSRSPGVASKETERSYGDSPLPPSGLRPEVVDLQRSILGVKSQVQGLRAQLQRGAPGTGGGSPPQVAAAVPPGVVEQPPAGGSRASPYSASSVAESAAAFAAREAERCDGSAASPGEGRTPRSALSVPRSWAGGTAALLDAKIAALEAKIGRASSLAAGAGEAASAGEAAAAARRREAAHIQEATEDTVISSFLLKGAGREV